jgi:hypothetical protein
MPSLAFVPRYLALRFVSERVLTLHTQIYTGRHPFPELANDFAVVMRAASKESPTRPDSACLEDDVWELMRECWDYEPESRPTASSAVKRLAAILGDAAASNHTDDWADSVVTPAALRSSLRPHSMYPTVTELEAMLMLPNSELSLPICDSAQTIPRF